MKVNQIQNYQYYNKNGNRQNTVIVNNNACSSKNNRNIANINYAYFPNIAFTGFANSDFLKDLLNYNVPCLYCGEIMINPKEIHRIDSSDILAGPSKDAIKTLSKYYDRMHSKEKQIFKILSQLSETYPEKDFHDMLQEIRKDTLNMLRAEQAPIFDLLKSRASNLPYNEKNKFDVLISKTGDKLREVPTKVKFGRAEFAYKLGKLLENIEDQDFVENLKLHIESDFPHYSEPGAKEIQLKMLSDVNKSVRRKLSEEDIKYSKSFRDLFDTSASKIKDEMIVDPFNKKTFIYDLNQLLLNLPASQRDHLIRTAELLPTSNTSMAALIIKLSDTPAERIGLNLLYPSMGTIEHLKPRFCNGEDKLSNYALACSRDNAKRQHTKLFEYINNTPGSEFMIQNHFNSLIKIVKNGSFGKNKKIVKYIADLKNTIKEESNGMYEPDISKLNNNKKQRIQR